MRLVALAALLLGWVFFNHYGIDHVAARMPDPDVARRALFYIAQGAKGVIFAAVIGMLAPRRVVAIPLQAVCLWAIYEDTLVVSCRLAKGIKALPDVEMWSGLCGDWWYSAGLAVGLLAASVVGYGASRGR